ncbi:MAG: TldD/PmbA family protein [Spirochaetes bacterium]|nr:TldD/PmbA family protein [Spirochaetota bacterium]
MDDTKIKNILKKHQQKKMELYYQNSQKLSLGAFSGELSNFSFSEQEGYSARVLKDDKIGFSYTEDHLEQHIEAMIDQANENAGYTTADPAHTLNQGEEKLQSDQFYNQEIDQVTIDKKKQFVLDLEKTAKSADPRIINVPIAHYGDQKQSVIVANPQGMLKKQTQNFCYAYTEIMAEENGETSVGFWGMGKASFIELDYQKIVAKAVEEALSKLNAAEIQSCSCPAVFCEGVASDLFAVFFNNNSPFYAENVQLNVSKLKGKLNTKIASDQLTIIDDPLAVGIQRRVFDDEGVNCQKMTIIEQGILNNFYYNLYSAKKDTVQSTGHGMRGNHRGSVSTGATNVYLENGNLEESELIKEVDKGILVTEVEGLHAGVNQISGDISAGAKGFMIEKGKKTYGVKNFTLSINFFDLLNRIVLIGNNRRNDGFSHFQSPSILIEKVDFSGK